MIDQKRLLELKEQIEFLGWTAAEEGKAKEREIASLKEEIQRSALSRDECLENQRRDLTQTFEALLEQRDDSFSKKEREIGQQITQLDSRFEQLRTDNSRLKSELADALRRCELFDEELRMKDDQLRQIHWRVEDERSAKIIQDDAIQRQLQQLTIDLAVTKDTSQREAAEFAKSIEKVGF